MCLKLFKKIWICSTERMKHSKMTPRITSTSTAENWRDKWTWGRSSFSDLYEYLKFIISEMAPDTDIKASYYTFS